MVLTKSEMMALLQKEVRLLQHLITKIDPVALDYRPTPKQRSTIELLQYLSYMGPAMLRYAKGEPYNHDAWAGTVKLAASRGFVETLAEIATHNEKYTALLADMDDAAFRAELTGFDWA